jgi:NAD(P)-dependent dehydrogenase (short-subunit alcohol dehydrogenase family)
LQCAAKASRDIFLRSAQKETDDFKIITLLPGLVKTEMLEEAKEKGRNLDFF